MKNTYIVTGSAFKIEGGRVELTTFGNIVSVAPEAEERARQEEMSAFLQNRSESDGWRGHSVFFNSISKERLATLLAA